MKLANNPRLGPVPLLPSDKPFRLELRFGPFRLRCWARYPVSDEMREAVACWEEHRNQLRGEGQ